MESSELLQKLNEGAEALSEAQAKLTADVERVLQSVQQGGGGAATEQAIDDKLAIHNADTYAHGLDKPDSPMLNAIKAVASNAVSDLVGTGGGGTINLLPHKSTHGKSGSDPISPVDIGAVADDDPRLTDARTPSSHTHTVADIQGIDALGGDAGDVSLTEYVTQTVDKAIKAHDENPSSHAKMLSGIGVGNGSPIVGIARVETGGGAGLWFNVDADGNPISPTKSYFDNHPVFGGIQRQVVDGQIMGKIPQFWVKDVRPGEGMFAGKPIRLISPGQQDGYRIHPAFMHNTEQIPHFLLGCYQATDEGGNPKKLGSRSGKAPFVNVNFDAMKTYINNRNVNGVSGFMMWDVYQMAATQLLQLIEYATPDMQSVQGNGHVSSSSAVYTDATNQPNWRGFRGLFGNVWQMVDGVRADSNKRTEIFKNDGTRAWVSTGFSMTPYNGSSLTGYLVTMKTGFGDGYNFDDVFLPETLSGSANAGTYGDGFWGPVANGVCYAGGHWDNGALAGVFYLTFSYPSSHANTDIGSRLAKV